MSAPITRAVIYARYSSDRQTEQSIEGQVRVCEEYAAKEGLTIVGQYIDRAVSARTDNRPQFKAMIKDSALGLFDAIIVYKTDRFARSKYDSAIYKKQLLLNNVTLHYAAETIPDGPEGVILESLLEGLAEYYSLELGQKIKRGLRESAYKCQATGIRPFGYQVNEDKTFSVHLEEAVIVKKVFQDFLAGSSIAQIAREINALGFKTTRNGKFGQKSIRRILEAPRYIGTYIWRDIKIENGMPAIIDEATFYKAQEELERRLGHKRRTRPSNKYLLTGKAYCGECGALLHGVSGTGKSGKTYYYYRCSAKCGLGPIQVSQIEPYCASAVREYVLQLDVIEALSNAIWRVQDQDSEEQEELAAYKSKLQDLEKRQDNLLLALETAAAPSLVKRLEEIDQEIEALSHEAKVIEARSFKLTEEQLRFWLHYHMEHAQDEKILEDFISEIYVFKDSLELIFSITSPGSQERVRKDAPLVEIMGFEPMASAMRRQRSPN